VVASLTSFFSRNRIPSRQAARWKLFPEITIALGLAIGLGFTDVAWLSPVFAAYACHCFVRYHEFARRRAMLEGATEWAAPRLAVFAAYLLSIAITVGGPVFALIGLASERWLLVLIGVCASPAGALMLRDLYRNGWPWSEVPKGAQLGGRAAEAAGLRASSQMSRDSSDVDEAGIVDQLLD
jgi:hypothetical protein